MWLCLLGDITAAVSNLSIAQHLCSLALTFCGSLAHCVYGAELWNFWQTRNGLIRFVAASLSPTSFHLPETSMPVRRRVGVV
jgi:hypothetical protein